MFIFKITLPMNSSDGSFFKYDKTFSSDLYLIYKLSPSARVCISDTDRLLMFYLVLIISTFGPAVIGKSAKFIN
jgi:hypothetical protein